MVGMFHQPNPPRERIGSSESGQELAAKRALLQRRNHRNLLRPILGKNPNGLTIYPKQAQKKMKAPLPVRFPAGWMNLSPLARRKPPEEKKCLNGWLGFEPVRQREKRRKLPRMMKAGWIDCEKRRGLKSPGKARKLPKALRTWHPLRRTRMSRKQIHFQHRLI
jgi:hypothetical protein